MSAAHTPGPWTSKPAGCFIDEAGAPTTAPSEFHVDPIMAVLRVGNVSTERRAADARLIAAAPDLLSACAALLATVEDFDDTLNRAGSRHVERVEAARAAIAKATEKVGVARYVRETNELDGTDDGSDWREQRAQDLYDSERAEQIGAAYRVQRQR